MEKIISKYCATGEKAIISEDALEILSAYGIPVATYTFAYSATEAVNAAKKVGYPVVMKINTPQLIHKTEAKGVRVDIRNSRELKEHYNDLRKKVGSLKKGEKFSVAIQDMVSGGVETVMGMKRDPSFGPLIMFGLGGIYVEVMKDVTFRVNPLTDQGADDMIRNLKSYPLLSGFRGSDPVNINLLKDSLLRLSQLVNDFDEFDEIDINPFIASSRKRHCKAVDARFILK